MVEKRLRKSAWMEEPFFSMVPTPMRSGSVQYWLLVYSIQPVLQDNILALHGVPAGPTIEPSAGQITVLSSQLLLQDEGMWWTLKT